MINIIIKFMQMIQAILNYPLENIFVNNDENTVSSDKSSEDTEEEPPIPPIILTRYLYIKEDVLASLTLAILDKNHDEAIFWTCELYYSGFKQEVADYLMAIYRELFQSNNPRLCKFLDELYNQCLNGAHIVATIARNLAAQPRKYDVNGFCNLTGASINIDNNVEPRLLVVLSPENIKQYNQVRVNDELSARNVLSHACKYTIRKNVMNLFQCSHSDIPEESLMEMHRDQWLYYASFSPIWKRRISKYGGEVNHDDKIVEFDENDVDNGEDDFYENYGYELDEQSIEVLSKMIHLQKCAQLPMDEFCIKYGGTIKPKKKFIIIPKPN